MTNTLDEAAGFTKKIWVAYGASEMFLMVRPDADLDGRFIGFDYLAMAFVKVNGWMADIEGCEPIAPEDDIEF